jgi:hypothetical protein
VYTVLGFSLGWLAWSALVSVVNVLTALFVIAVEVYASLLLFGVLLFTGIGVRRLIARRIRNPGRADSLRSLLDITPPIVVADDPDCKFYRRAADALAVGITPTMKVFDAQGHRLVAKGSEPRMSSSDPDGAAELAAVLRQWLGYMDAIRWSTADMGLPTLLEASVEHLGYSR